jgi:undecaprenyl-diphosphatase
MHPYLEAILLGLIEGVTEFLPISSTGHLLIAQQWLARRSELFNIAIQAGAILAIMLVYRVRLTGLLRNTLLQRDLLTDACAYLRALRAAPRTPVPSQPAHSAAAPAEQAARLRDLDYVVKVGAAFAVTAMLGLVVKALGWELPETVIPVAWALIVGGVFILLAERIAAQRVRALGERADITWTVAALVGLAQVVAGVFPGTSRSAAAIFAALLFGVTRRPAATEFAFLVGIPTMFAATGYALLDTLLERGVGGEDWGQLLVAFATAAVTGFVVVRWLLRYVQGHSFAPFAYYRFALGAALLLWFS